MVEPSAVFVQEDHAYQEEEVLLEDPAADVVEAHDLAVEHLLVVVVHGPEVVDHVLEVEVHAHEEAHGQLAEDLDQVVVVLALVDQGELHA